MSIELTGNEQKIFDMQYRCMIQKGSCQYFGSVVSQYYEYDIWYNNEIIYNARIDEISKLNTFLNRLTLSFSDSKKVLFKIRSSGLRGILGFGMELHVKGQILKLPRKFSFNLPKIGYDIKMNGTKFQSSIKDENDIGIGIGLSYHVWLQQQRWIKTD